MTPSAHHQPWKAGARLHDQAETGLQTYRKESSQMSETPTTNTRPASHDDLHAYQREGHRVATVNGDMLTRFPSVGQHLLAALVEAKALGLDVTDDGQITVPLTEEELDQKLYQAQRSWDTSRQWYEAAKAGDEVEGWKRSTIESWAKAEGADPIDWAAYDARTGADR